jgi:DNA-binding CsgD family transcriptional regulator
MQAPGSLKQVTIKGLRGHADFPGFVVEVRAKEGVRRFGATNKEIVVDALRIVGGRIGDKVNGAYEVSVPLDEWESFCEYIKDVPSPQSYVVWEFGCYRARRARSRVHQDESRQQTLSEPELLVLQGIADGLNNHEIAGWLADTGRAYLAPDTIRHTADRMRAKLGAKDKAHAVSIGYKTGLLKVAPEEG